MTDRPLIHIHIPKTAGMAIVKTLGYNSRYKHLGHPFPAGQIKAGKISQLVWEMGIKFTVVRDPLDRLASLYFYMRNRMAKRPKDLADFFHNFRDPQLTYNYMQPQVRWLETGIDHILNFHFLPRDWRLFCHDVGIAHRPLIPQNVRRPQDEQPKVISPQPVYHHLFSEDLKQQVREYYHEDYDTFSFPGDLP